MKKVGMAVGASILCSVLVLAITFALLYSGLVTGQTLHSWTTGQVVTATDLNGNFTALKNGKVGSGVQASNTDIASNAAISHSKMATPALLPKAWGYISAACTGSTAAGTACTIGDSTQISSITTNGSSGQFRINLSYTPANANFAVIVTSHTTASVCIATTQATSAPHALVKCFDYTGAANDTNQFSVLVLDS